MVAPAPPGIATPALPDDGLITASTDVDAEFDRCFG